MARGKCFFDDITKELECSVCQKQFSEIKEPKILKCLHTFCKTCLDSLLRRGSMGRYLYPLNEVSAGAKAERVDLAANLCQKHVVFLYILVVFLYIDRFLGHL